MSIKIDDKEPKTYIVLGAPHSATSLLAKGLHEAGIEMHPEKYRYEDIDFVKMNFKILSGDYKESEIEELINSKKGKLWGWKDPRTSLTLDKYLPYLTGDVYLFCCFRAPKKLLANWKKTKHTSGGRKLLNRFNNSLLKNVREFLKTK